MKEITAAEYRQMKGFLLTLHGEVKKMKEEQVERLYTVKAVAEEMLCCSRPTVYKLIKEGKLTPVAFYSDLRIRYSDLLAYINSLPPGKQKKIRMGVSIA